MTERNYLIDAEVWGRLPSAPDSTPTTTRLTVAIIFALLAIAQQLARINGTLKSGGNP